MPSSTRTITGAQIDQLSDLDEVIATQREVFAAYSRGEAVMGPRAIISQNENAQFSYIARASKNGPTIVKFGSVVPGNAKVSLPVVQTTVALMDAQTGSAQTFFDGEAITKWRTVAASMAAAKELSNPVSTMAIVGVGHQGIAHAEAAVKVFRPKRLILISRSKIDAPHYECEVSVSDRIEDVNEAELIFVCTNSSTPVITQPVKEGATCIVIGSFAPNRSEIGVAALSQADAVFGDDSQTITAQCGSVIDAKCQNVESIGDVYNGTSKGRSSANQVIYYFSVGLGIQDAAMADYVLSKLSNGAR